MQKKTKKEYIKEEIPEEENKNIEMPSSEEENSENPDQEDSPKVNIASFITTPYERVLKIINEAKTFILSVSSTQQELIKGLEWAIKVISSHNLYTYELKDQEASKENQASEDFKQFVQFVNSYNDFIPTNKKQTGKGRLSSRDLKRPIALMYNLHKVEEEKEQKIEEEIVPNINNKINEEKNFITNKKINTSNISNKNTNDKLAKSFQKIKDITNTDKKIKKFDKKETSKTNKTNKVIKPNKKIKPISPIRTIKKSINNILTPKNELKEKKKIVPKCYCKYSTKRPNKNPKSNKNI